jgi:hypothetical protein
MGTYSTESTQIKFRADVFIAPRAHRYITAFLFEKETECHSCLQGGRGPEGPVKQEGDQLGDVELAHRYDFISLLIK